MDHIGVADDQPGVLANGRPRGGGGVAIVGGEGDLGFEIWDLGFGIWVIDSNSRYELVAPL
jgi:hypothetical protein